MDLRWMNKRSYASLGAFLFALLMGLLSSFVAERTFGAEVVARGVTVDGKLASGMDRGKLKSLISARRRQVEEAKLAFVLRDAVLEKKAGDVDVFLDVERAVDVALRKGREGSWLRQFGFFVARLFGRHPIILQTSSDVTKLRETLVPWAEALIEPPRRASISYDGSLQVEPGRGGEAVDLVALSARFAQLEVSRIASQTKPLRLRVPTQHLPPLVSKESVEKEAERAKQLLATPLLVVSPSGDEELTLQPGDLGAALISEIDEKKGTISLSLSTDLLRRALSPLLSQWEKEAKDASFEFSQAGAVQVIPSENGATFDEEALVRELWNSAPKKEGQLRLKLKESLPELTTEDAESLGVSGLVMSFTTFHPCCQPRVQNIHHAAQKLDGVVLRPGATFSLNKHLGRRQESTGYEMAPTIVRGEMQEMFGGGISQLATTLFNAVLRGGYEIVQRQPHSVYFSRYPEGHEATVSYPEPDLIFRNDTSKGMVIKTHAAPTLIKVLVYGDNEGRKTTVKKSRRYDITQPPKEYEPDEEMDPEVEKRLTAGQMGWKVLVSRTVKYQSGEEKVEKREVVYSPRPEVVRVHPCKIPKGEKGHTGEECPEPEIVEREEDLAEGVYYETL